MDGFERRRQQKKESILNAALELFKQHGYNKVSIAEIAAKASVSQVSIYNFFQNKENLKRELLKKLLDDHFQNTLEILESEKPVDVKLVSFFTNRVNFFKDNSFNFMLESIKEGLLNKNEYIDQEKLEKIDRLVLELFEEGKKQGILKYSVSLQAMAAIFEIFQYYFINNQEALVRYKQNPQLYKDIISTLFDMLSKK